VSHELEVFVGANAQWLQASGESYLRNLPADDQRRVIQSGPLKGVRDPCRVMYTRLQKAKEMAGEIEPYEVRMTKKRRREGIWTPEEWSAWMEGRWTDELEHATSSSEKHQNRDDTWGNDNGCGVFFAKLAPDVNEEILRGFAQAAGTVLFVKIFMDHQTGNSKGCGKVFYETKEMAQRAIEELHNTDLYGRRVSLEVLGGERRSKNRNAEARPKNEDEESIAILPYDYFVGCVTKVQKIERCCSALEEILGTHDEKATGKGMVWMVRSLVKEINEAFPEEDEMRQELVYKLKNHQWFWDNAQQLKWQASKRRINISKVTPCAIGWHARQQGLQDFGGKGQGQGQGFVRDARAMASSMEGWNSGFSQAPQAPEQSIWTPAASPAPLPQETWPPKQQHPRIVAPTRPQAAAGGGDAGGAWWT